MLTIMNLGLYSQIKVAFKKSYLQKKRLISCIMDKMTSVLYGTLFILINKL
jgi:hypothetical protein